MIGRGTERVARRTVDCIELLGNVGVDEAAGCVRSGRGSNSERSHRAFPEGAGVSVSQYRSCMAPLGGVTLINPLSRGPRLTHV